MTIALQAVNELIASLESAGELSIREQKFLKLAKAFKQLAAENVEMKQIIDSVTNLDNEPQYHDEGMGCGLEDRGITDRYDACRYGWDEAMERIYGEVIPCADELDFPATDAFLAGIKADGRVEGAHFVANRMLAAWDAGFIEDTAKNAADIARMILTSTEFMANAPEGDFDRSFADGILEDIAQQLREGAK
ncbi:TPA: hypothetical protein MA014_001045 [Klebsiella pneumoniae]|nr:hypothetical protein [Klebsiella pneumoniae]